MTKKRGLGKSLDLLLAYTKPVQSSDQACIQEAVLPLRQLSLAQIQPGQHQPRQNMDPTALEELAASIRLQGIMQPLLVRSLAKQPGHFEIIAGERRFRAAQLAGLASVPAIIHEVSDHHAMAMALVENIQREDLNSIEKAAGLHRLIEEFSMTHQAVADAVGQSRATVSNLLRLLSLAPAIQDLLRQKKLEMGHARALITLPQTTQVSIAEQVIKKMLSVRETEKLVHQTQHSNSRPLTHTQLRTLDPDVARLQERLSRQLNLRVSLRCSNKGKGKLIIHYRTLQELDKLLQQLHAQTVSLKQ